LWPKERLFQREIAPRLRYSAAMLNRIFKKKSLTGLSRTCG